MQSNSPQGDLSTKAEIANKAKELIQAGDVLTSRPVFDVKGGVLSFYFGKVFVKAGKHPEYVKQPIRVPLQTQLRIEQLRRFFSERNHRYISFWSTYLDATEGVVGMMMEDIRRKSTDQDSLNASLALRESLVEKILEQAVQIFAAKNKYSLKPVQEVRAKIINVKFVSDPPGAEMKIVQGILYQASGDALSESLWQDVTGGNVTPISAGDWQVRRRWNKNDPWEYGVESINFEGPYMIKKKPQ